MKSRASFLCSTSRKIANIKWRDCETSKQASSDMLSLERPHSLIFPQQYKQLGTNFSNARGYRGTFYSNNHKFKTTIFFVILLFHDFDRCTRLSSNNFQDIIHFYCQLNILLKMFNMHFQSLSF